MSSYKTHCRALIFALVIIISNIGQYGIILSFLFGFTEQIPLLVPTGNHQLPNSACGSSAKIYLSKGSFGDHSRCRVGSLLQALMQRVECRLYIVKPAVFLVNINIFVCSLKKMSLCEVDFFWFRYV